MNLHLPVESGGRIFKLYAGRLEKLGIITFNDFLYHVPTRYEDYSKTSTISEATFEQPVSLKATVLSIQNSYTRNRKNLQKAVVTDGSGTVDVIWFNQPYLVKQIKTNDLISLAGRIEQSGNKLVMQSPDYELLTDDQTQSIHTSSLVPIYHETKGVSSKWLRRQIFKLLQETQPYAAADPLPPHLIKQFNFPNLSEALQSIHFPKTYEEAARARERLAFDELFLLQLQTIHRRHLWRQTNLTQPLKIEVFRPQIQKLLDLLPFSLTDAQLRAVETILTDLQENKPMNRLLQGDVGSGKTIVAAISMYVTVLNGKQAVLMAPTEILAEQHFASLKRILKPLGVKLELITGNTKLSKVKREKSLESKDKSLEQNEPQASNLKPLTSQNADILVGTHALLYDKADFSNAGLVVIDEQQRFGVEQRAIMRVKGNNPHVLTMTATPIPRTMALTIYGDLDLSFLDQMPVGRKTIKTWLVPPEKRDGAYHWIRKQIVQTNSQTFVICPFIEESENMQTVKAAAVEFERLKKDVFPDLKLGLIHGRMKAKEKDEVLLQFRNRDFDILVATPVVEVGIDIPNATIILIEASERFGLSQLHQLRGRVGRGDKQSYCLLFTESRNLETNNRLKALETLHEGAKLAELDLKLRGSGDIYGTQQSGYRMLKIASFSDSELIEKARNAAREIYKNIEQYPKLKERIIEKTTKQISQD